MNSSLLTRGCAARCRPAAQPTALVDWRVLVLALLSVIAVACASGPHGASRDAVRVGEVLGEGDATRRASQRVVMQGLEADGSGNDRLGLSLYERALSVDPTNPYAYLALARHHIERGEYERALEYVDQAEVLFGAQDDGTSFAEASPSPRAEAHIAGLRGAALRGLGRDREGDEWLRRASDLSPSVWGDGVLSPAELR